MMVLNDKTFIYDKCGAKKYLDSLGFDWDELYDIMCGDTLKKMEELDSLVDYHERQADAYFCHLNDLTRRIEEIGEEMKSASKKQKRTFAKELMTALQEFGID